MRHRARGAKLGHGFLESRFLVTGSHRSLAQGHGWAKAKKVEGATLKLNTTKWKQAIGASSVEGKAAMPNRLTYRWVKGLEGWPPSKIAPNAWHDECEVEDSGAELTAELQLQGYAEGDFDIPLSDQAVVDSEAEDWAVLWQETAHYVAPDFDHSPPLASPLLEEGIRMAARSFPANTGLGADNVAARAIARLSSPAIIALIALFLCFEAAGDWCMAVNLVLIVLLPKPDGGRRPIGLFPTIIRIWMRARIWAAREWERLHDHYSLFAGPDMGA